MNCGIMTMSKLWFLLVAVLAMVLGGGAWGANLVPPEDPRQSITYWKPHTLAPDTDADVALAYEVFDTLLRTWDDARVTPNLFVVVSDNGPWAASLADGNILLSRSAIDICKHYGRQQAAHLLAFVLAHELAHQRADDMWHYKFFRLAGAQVPQVQQQMLRGLSADDLADLERREAQADHDGLMMMSIVGYDPNQVVQGKDFFTTWAESIWRGECGATDRSVPQTACQQAQSRAARAGAQLQTVAAQATLYEMAVQQLVAGDLETARLYLRGFGRDYPGREIYTSLGASYFLEALRVDEILQREGLSRQPAFFYPLLLDAQPALPATLSAKRGGDTRRRDALQGQRSRLLQKAVDAYEKAQQLAPQHAMAYFMTALSYLLDGNVDMVRGILRGKYRGRFGGDAAVDLLLAMSDAMEGKTARALRQTERLARQAVQLSYQGTLLPRSLYVYAACYNHGVQLRAAGRNDDAAALWLELARHAQAAGDSMLFRLAVAQLRPATETVLTTVDRDALPGMPLPGAGQALLQEQEVWLEGEKLSLRVYADGSRQVSDAGGRVLARWYRPGVEATPPQSNLLGDGVDRAFKSLGMPDRYLHLSSGDFLAYDRQGLALQVMRNRVAGWFRYSPVAQP